MKNPIEYTQNIQIPIQNVSCVRGPFGTAQLQIILPQQIGSSEQEGVLKTEFFETISERECHSIIEQIPKLESKENIELNAQILNRSVAKLTSANAYTCEVAQQEIVSIKVGNTTAYESIIKSQASLDCPAGIYPYHVNTKDQVIYVLHENGIPTKSDF